MVEDNRWLLSWLSRLYVQMQHAGKALIPPEAPGENLPWRFPGFSCRNLKSPGLYLHCSNFCLHCHTGPPNPAYNSLCKSGYALTSRVYLPAPASSVLRSHEYDSTCGFLSLLGLRAHPLKSHLIIIITTNFLLPNTFLFIASWDRT